MEFFFSITGILLTTHFFETLSYVLEYDRPKSRIYCLSNSRSLANHDWYIWAGLDDFVQGYKAVENLKRLKFLTLWKYWFMESTQDFPGVLLITSLIQHSRWPSVSVRLCERFDSFRADKVITRIELRDDESRASTDNKAIRAANNFLFLNNYFLLWDFKTRLLLESVSQASFFSSLYDEMYNVFNLFKFGYVKYF